MNSQIPRVLLLSACDSTSFKVTKLLSNHGFKIDSIRQLEELECFIRENAIDAIICDQVFEGRKGLELYQHYQATFQNIPFFLILNEFDAEEVMIALEIGIVNLIFPPFTKASLVRKVENELINRKNSNILKTKEFEDLFEESLSLKILVREERIFRCNAALQEMNPGFFCVAEGVGFEEVFDLELHKGNSLNIKRLQSGVSNIVKLTKVKCRYSDCIFDMILFKGGQSVPGEFLVELTPIESSNKDDEIRIPAGVPISYVANGEKIHLTDREVQVLELSAAGLPIKVIAIELGVSNRTVEKHRANIMEKLGAGNIIEAIFAWYVQLGVIKQGKPADFFDRSVLN